jgi:hypothetical protein
MEWFLTKTICVPVETEIVLQDLVPVAEVNLDPEALDEETALTKATLGGTGGSVIAVHMTNGAAGTIVEIAVVTNPAGFFS